MHKSPGSLNRSSPNLYTINRIHPFAYHHRKLREDRPSIFGETRGILQTFGYCSNSFCHLVIYGTTVQELANFVHDVDQSTAFVDVWLYYDIPIHFGMPVRQMKVVRQFCPNFFTQRLSSTYPTLCYRIQKNSGISKIGVLFSGTFFPKHWIRINFATLRRPSQVLSTADYTFVYSAMGVTRRVARVSLRQLSATT